MTMRIRFCELSIAFRTQSQTASNLILRNFDALRSVHSTPADLTYEVFEDSGGFTTNRECKLEPLSWQTADAGEFLFLLEKDLTIQSQRLRPDLYHLHAAALQHKQAAFLLIGSSGSGKSTTSWGLLNRGCGYLSDELAPVDLEALAVHPFPHALCLKAIPPAPYALPNSLISMPPRLYVPAEDLPTSIVTEPVPLSAIFHIRHLTPEEPVKVEEIGSAESASLIYANALNPLCHPELGLDAAVEIASRSKSFRVTSGELTSTVSEILSTLDGVARDQARELIG